MKLAVKKVALVGALLCTVLLGSLVIPDVAGRNTIVMGFVDKIEMVNRIPDRKIVVLGGSASYFAVSARTIEENQRLRCYNYGTHAGIGMRYMLQTVGRALRSGDVLVIVPEYEQYDEETEVYYGEVNLLALLCSSEYKEWGMLNIRQWYRMIMEFPSYASSRWIALLYQMSGIKKYIDHDVYSRSAILPSGDVSPVYTDESHQIKISFHISEISDDVVDDISILLKNIASRNIEVLFAPPPLPLDVYKKNVKTIDAFWTRITKEGTVLFAPSDVAYDRRMFYDTIYHLNNAGRMRYTASIIESLENHVR